MATSLTGKMLSPSLSQNLHREVIRGIIKRSPEDDEGGGGEKERDEKERNKKSVCLH